MSHETIEQAAFSYITKTQASEHSAFYDSLNETFIAGASWREQQAASGLQEWWDSVAKEAYRTKPTSDVEKTWQASQLSSAKLLAEKDAEIEKAKEIIKYLCKTGIDYHIAEKIKALLGEE